MENIFDVVENQLSHIKKPLELVQKLEHLKNFQKFDEFYGHLFFTDKQNMIINLNREYLQFGLTHDDILMYIFFKERHILFTTVDDYFKSYILSDYKDLTDTFKKWRPTIYLP